MTGSAIIIGSGLGGLECGYILSKHGIKVTILEKADQPGGCLQSFKRLGRTFDTGFHYVGGLSEGESLYPLMKYFSLMDLPWKMLDKEAFDQVVIGDESFCLASGHDAFVESLSERFPHQKDNLRQYAKTLKVIGDNIFGVFTNENRNQINELFSKSAYEFLNETISDPLLSKVLSGTSLKIGLNADTLPLYVFAQINNSFIQSSWRIDGGGSLIVKSLCDSIKSMEGEIRCSSEVTSMIEEGGKITKVEVNGEEILSADWVISDIHPSLTLSLVQSSMLRKVYRNRIANLKNSVGAFTANICLKKDTVPYQNSNLFIHSKDADLWRPDPSKTESVMVHYYVPEGEDKTYASAIDLMSAMDYSEVSSWENLPVGRRGSAYQQIKNRKFGECLNLVKEHVPGLLDGMEAVFTSSPLTYKDYTGSPFGSAYGISKDWCRPLETVLSPRTPVSNLLLTGQSLNLHGVLGVSMTSVLTCSAIVGMDTLRQEILSI